MGILTWLIVGAIVGWLAGLMIKGRSLGLIGNIVVGIVGAMIGGWVASAAFNIQDPISGFNLTTFLVALFGAIILLLIVRLVSR